MRNIALSPQALEDFLFWSINDVRLLRKIFDLMESMLRDPFGGIGKPEALKGDLSGFWSRRINDEHRIVYKVTTDFLIIASCRSHYKK
ncbi:MAG TPA: Txe/YoeB family addiction module toxin [Flavisolibacter sp.]|nr:Txe/YoeB family addiction module toxin [Flavisolibacter sp.]